MSRVLINEVLETFSEPFALILDDLHRISEPSTQASVSQGVSRRNIEPSLPITGIGRPS